MKNILLSLIIFPILITGCKENLPEEKVIVNSPYHLINQDGEQIKFPDSFKGNIIVAGFIFTNCPDICPMTTYNMNLIRKRLAENKIYKVKFAAISFDPQRDTPRVLKEYAKLRQIKTDDFLFLTGEKTEIDSLLKAMNIIAIAEDTSFTEDGEPVYFFAHTDRISLIDQNGFIRKEYKGSQINIEEIVSDIKLIGD